jgi:hypothetical protein
MGGGGALGGVQGMGSASIAAAAAADSEPVPRRSALPAGRRGPAMTKGAVLQQKIFAGIFEIDFCFVDCVFFCCVWCFNADFPEERDNADAQKEMVGHIAATLLQKRRSLSLLFDSSPA